MNCHNNGYLKDDMAIIHIFAFQWKPGTSDEHRGRAISEIRRFSGKIPGLLELWVGENMSAHSSEYEIGGVMRFSNEHALAGFQKHPLRTDLWEWLLPLIEPIEVSFFH